MEIPGFKEKISSWWEEMRVEGSASFIFGEKLKILKEKVIQWKRKEFGGL